MKWKVVCFLEHSQLYARTSPLWRWRRLSPFRSAALPGTLARAGAFGNLLLRPTSGRLEDYVALGHAGRPESGLHEQAPRDGSVPERPISRGSAGDVLNFEPTH